MSSKDRYRRVDFGLVDANVYSDFLILLILSFCVDVCPLRRLAPPGHSIFRFADYLNVLARFRSLLL